MKKKLLALICALALVFSLVGCTISAPDTVGSIGDFEITSGMYLLAQYGAYQQAAQLAGTDQDTTDVKAFLKETITTDSDSGETAVVSDYVAQKTQETLETLVWRPSRHMNVCRWSTPPCWNWSTAKTARPRWRTTS